MFCVHCGNNIKSSNKQLKISNKQLKISVTNYKITSCPRWIYNIKCDCCNKRNNYKNFIAS